MTRDETDSHDNGELEGRYANCFQIGQNAQEFVLEFGQAYEEDERTHFYVRIVTSPYYAKQLLRTLQQAIDQHEREFRPIHDEDEPEMT